MSSEAKSKDKNVQKPVGGFLTGIFSQIVGEPFKNCKTSTSSGVVAREFSQHVIERPAWKNFLASITDEEHRL